MSKINIFLFLPVFLHLYFIIDAYTPLVHLPADDKNYVPKMKFISKDFPEDYGPITLTTKRSSLSSLLNIFS